MWGRTRWRSGHREGHGRTGSPNHQRHIALWRCTNHPCSRTGRSISPLHFSVVRVPRQSRDQFAYVGARANYRTDAGPWRRGGRRRARGAGQGIHRPAIDSNLTAQPSLIPGPLEQGRDPSTGMHPWHGVGTRAGLKARGKGREEAHLPCPFGHGCSADVPCRLGPSKLGTVDRRIQE